MGEAIAIIPARGGSKRIPRKNIREFAGRPMIAWPVGVARSSGLFARVVVSTDDDEIAETARAAGAEVPFRRDAALSDDHAGTTEVIRDAVARLGLAADTAVACIYPTGVFVTAGDLRAGRDLLEGGADWVLSVGAYTTPIQRAYRREGDRLVPFQHEMMEKRSQDLEPAYFDAGQFYWARAASWADPGRRIWDGAAAVELPHDRVCDIDTEDDWATAERLFREQAR